MNLLKRFWRWLISLVFRREGPRRFSIVEDLPDELNSHTVYLVGENDFIWQVAMICPCGCDETLHMPVLEETRPRWRYTVHADDTVTLYPSVWRRTGCRSHFHLRRGLITWCQADCRESQGHGRDRYGIDSDD